MSTPIVTDNPQRSRFELTVDGTLAGVLDYRLVDGVADMFHTEILEDFRGRALGVTLVRAAIDHARGQDWRIVPTCWFVRDYLAAHPADAALLAR